MILASLSRPITPHQAAIAINSIHPRHHHITTLKRPATPNTTTTRRNSPKTSISNRANQAVTTIHRITTHKPRRRPITTIRPIHPTHVSIPAIVTPTRIHIRHRVNSPRATDPINRNHRQFRHPKPKTSQRPMRLHPICPHRPNRRAQPIPT